MTKAHIAHFPQIKTSVKNLILYHISRWVSNPTLFLQIKPLHSIRICHDFFIFYLF